MKFTAVGPMLVLSLFTSPFFEPSARLAWNAAIPSVHAASPASPSERQAGVFVQNFYNWYLAKQKSAMNRRNAVAGWELAIKEKPGNFSPDLLKALKEDLEASEKVLGEIVGLDFDPILNAQDIAGKCEAGKVTQVGDRYLVEVYGYWEGKKNPKPDVTPELALRDGLWVFTNFHYGKSKFPVNENLISILRQLKKDRSQAPQSH